jgi:hypothetical protein
MRPRRRAGLELDATVFRTVGNRLEGRVGRIGSDTWVGGRLADVVAWRSMARGGLALAIMLAWAGVTFAHAAEAALPPSVFSYTGGEQSYTVPPGVTELRVDAIGAPGDPGSGVDGETGGVGSDGASVTGEVVVVPGEVLYVEVGGGAIPVVNGERTPFNGGGFGGSGDGSGGFYGGAGGGASDVRTCSMSAQTGCSTADSRLLVAGGGGGGGGSDLSDWDGDAGGGSAQDGQAGVESGPLGGGGGGGGGLYGGGYAGDLCPPLSAGDPDAFSPAEGNSGSFGQGAGAFNAGDADYGGGGGGGWFGGGSGVACGYYDNANAPALGYFGAGGGGGSSYGPPGTVFAHDTTGVPSVTITPLTGAVSLSVPPLAFRNTSVGAASAAKSVTITNGGDGPLSVSGWSVAGSDPTDFVIGSWGCDGPIGPGARCSFSVYFAPRGVGGRSATLLVTSDDPAGPATVTLSGIGTPANGTTGPKSCTRSARPNCGRLVGALIVSGAAKGPGHCGCSYEPGNVQITSRLGVEHRVKVPQSGHFSIRLPAGRYHAIGGIPSLQWKLGECTVDTPRPPSWIRVTAGRTVRIVVDCHGH